MTLKDFEEALLAQGCVEALNLLAAMRETERALRASNRLPRRRASKPMTPALAAEIVNLHAYTELNQQEIATLVGVNSGRVNEVIRRGRHL